MTQNNTLRVIPCDVPDETFLAAYRDINGAYTDVYCGEGPRADLHDFVRAFYSSSMFTPERWLLFSIGRGSGRQQIAQLARGDIDRFAAWDVEHRSPTQILLRDFAGTTRSWLQVENIFDERTRFFFGSAVVPTSTDKNGDPALGPAFKLLLGFHRAYSRALLWGAMKNVSRRQAAQSSTTFPD